MAASNKPRIPVPSSSSSLSPLTPLPDTPKQPEEQVSHSESEESASPTPTTTIPAQVMMFAPPGESGEDLTNAPHKKKDKGKRRQEPEDSPLLHKQKEAPPHSQSPALVKSPSTNPFHPEYKQEEQERLSSIPSYINPKTGLLKPPKPSSSTSQYRSLSQVKDRTRTVDEQAQAAFIARQLQSQSQEPAMQHEGWSSQPESTRQ